MNPNQSFCLNPDCLKPGNLPQSRFCVACGSPTTINGNAYSFRDGKYLVKNLLGEGAFGRAYQAVEPKLFSRPCVIKKFIANFPNSDDVEYARNAFEREAKQLLTLKHPQIPTLHDYLSYDLNGVPSLYLVQEWIEGKNLDEVWRSQGNFSPKQTRGLLLSLLPVLGYLHDNGIIHRDIKPSNIMLQQSMAKYVLIDFGGAKATTGTTLAATRAIHTPGYAAIEQLMGQACEASDLYSLGATCVRLMTGGFPEFDRGGNVINDPLYDARGDRWIWREYLEKQGVQVDADLEQVLNKLLARLAIHRYQTAAEALLVLDPSRVVIPNVGAGGISSPNIPSIQQGQAQVEGTSTPPIQPQQGLFGKLKQLFGTEANTPPQNPLLTQKLPLPYQSAPQQPPPQHLPYQQYPAGVTQQSPKPYASVSPRIVHQNFVEDLGGGMKLEMIVIPLGSFKDAEGNIVKITEPFYMGKYQITQAQSQAVMGKNPSRFKGQDLPVEKVSWDDCQAFCQKLSQSTGKIYRLPSEAEWEYCCRAVTSENARVTEYCFGNDKNLLDQYAWYNENSSGKTHSVGQKKPNHFGLYDMHGNVWEWCEDDWSNNYQQPRIQKAYKHPVNSRKILRGGSWFSDPYYCRSDYRYRGNTLDRLNVFGFRAACFVS